MCCQSMLQTDLHTRRRVFDPSRPSQDAASPTQSIDWDSSHNRTVIWKINDSTSSHLISRPQLHSCSPGPFCHASDCSNGPTELWLWPLLMLQPTNSKAKRRSAQVQGQGLPICEEDDPRLHISRRLYARRAAPVHSQSTANHHHQKPSRHPFSNTSPPVEPHLTSKQNLDLEASVCRIGGTGFCTLPLIMLTAPDSAMTVVVRHHPIEAPLQPSRLRRVFHLPCVQHLHKSKLTPAIVASSAPVLHSRKRARILRASV